MITVIARDMDLFLRNLRGIVFSISILGEAVSCRSPRATAEPAGSKTSISVLLLLPAPVLLYCIVPTSLELAPVSLQLQSCLFSFPCLSLPNLNWEQQHFEVVYYECVQAAQWSTMNGQEQ